MADKKPAEKPAEKPFQLDKKSLLDQVPLIGRPVAGALIDAFNKFDADHDGVPEIAKWAPLFFNATPLFLELAKHIDWGKVISFFAKDRAKATELIGKIRASLLPGKENGAT